jgi:hypothetical protein
MAHETPLLELAKEFGVFVHRLLRSRSFSVRQPPDSIPLVKSRSLPLVECVSFSRLCDQDR